jgi:hypothetical protein
MHRTNMEKTETGEDCVRRRGRTSSERAYNAPSPRAGIASDWRVARA